MSDKKNSPNVNLEANLAKIANTKPRKRMRNDNIYERFITRVENVDSVEDDATVKENALKPLKNTNKLSSYEPLSAAELELFATKEQEEQQRASLQKSESTSTGINVGFSDEDEDSVAHHATITNNNNADDLTRQDLTESVAQKVKKAKNEQPDNQSFDNTEAVNDKAIAQPLAKTNKQSGSKKPLIIGMIFGSLLIAAIVITLIFTGVLSTSAQKDVTDSADDDTVSSTEPPEIAESLEQENQPLAAPNTAETQDNVTNQNQSSVSGSAAQNANDESADPSITYEDFRQESQSTLYRETND